MSKRPLFSKTQPVRSYKKYVSQHKVNPLLHRLSSDSGYPQDILSPTLEPRQPPNFLLKNTENLKNFFKDRLPPSNPPLIPTNKLGRTIDPAAMFQIRQREQNLKSQTKMSLRNWYQPAKSYCLDQSREEKIVQNFSLRGPSKSVQVAWKQGPRTSDSHRMGTKSFIHKRAEIPRQLAYEKVFGQPVCFSLKDDQSFQIQVEPRLQESNVRAKQVHKGKREEFRALLQKMTVYRKQLEPNSTMSEQYIAPSEQQPEVDESDHGSRMITLIKTISKTHKYSTVTDRNNLNTLDDLRKIDPNFYDAMVQHKKGRLSRRVYIADNESVVCKVNASQGVGSGPQRRSANLKEEQDVSVISQNSALMNHSFGYSQAVHVYQPVVMRIHALRKSLCAAIGNCQIFKVPKRYIHEAFWKVYDPFQMEGSYVLFKMIRAGNLQEVELFVNKGHQYLFQIDFEGSSTLAYACRHNQTKIAEFFINSGLNIDQVSYNGRNALYYALENRNEQLVGTLLRAGVTPWSNEKNPFSRLLQGLPKRFSFLLRNARKIWIARAFMKSRTARHKIWDDNKVYISGDRQIQWDHFTSNRGQYVEG